MAKAADGTFFDVLIDRLVADVRRDFEAELRANSETAPELDPRTSPFVDFDGEAKKTAPPAAYDDLVSKMIGFRARLVEPAALIATSRYGSASGSTAPARFNSNDVKNLVSTAARKTATPKFSSSAADTACGLVTKAGAKFYDEDLEDGHITPDALKRERRRVLLTLHPDRAPEADRAEAHTKFLDAAEAFSVLAEALTGFDRARAA